MISFYPLLVRGSIRQSQQFKFRTISSHYPVSLSKFTVRDSYDQPIPLTEEKAYDILHNMNDLDRNVFKTALERYEAKKIKESFEGALAATRWRSRFGRPAKMPALGDVDPTGSYCAVPEDWIKRKSVENAPAPTNSELWKVFLVNAVPFVGFGFFDNFIMIIAGDYIENLFGMFMCISTMAAAGLGNTISDILGIGSAYYIERLSSILGLRPPKLTPHQFEMKKTRRWANTGRMFGITLGCLIGMFPLLFIDSKKDSSKDENKED